MSAGDVAAGGAPLSTPFTLHFADSEVKRISHQAGTLRVVFSAARVTLPPGPAGTPRPAYALGLVMRMTGLPRVSGGAGAGGDVGSSTDPLADCVGSLSGGRLSAAGQPQARVPLPGLPFGWQGNSQVELEFSNGAVWSAQAWSVAFEWEGEPRLMESLDCRE